MPDTFQAGIDATYARFNTTNFNGFTSGPLSDTLRARLSFNVDEGGAWQKSDTRNDTLGNKDNKFGRLLLDWTPTDALRISVNLNGGMAAFQFGLSLAASPFKLRGQSLSLLAMIG